MVSTSADEISYVLDTNLAIGYLMASVVDASLPIVGMGFSRVRVPNILKSIINKPAMFEFISRKEPVLIISVVS